jgi:hypothetical protein
MVSAALKPLVTEPDIEAIWWMPPSSPNTMSWANEVRARLVRLCSYPVVA